MTRVCMFLVWGKEMVVGIFGEEEGLLLEKEAVEAARGRVMAERSGEEKR